MSPPERVYIALGSNLGKREQYLAAAREALGKIPLTRMIAESAIEETPPQPGSPPQPNYLNQMVLVETGLDPQRFLAALRKIEDANDRVRGEKWGPRTLDLDIVRFGTRRLRDPDLIVPHPQLATREWWQREIEELDAKAPKQKDG